MERKYGSLHFPLTRVLLVLREMVLLTDILSVSAQRTTWLLHSQPENVGRWEEDGQTTCGETEEAPTGTEQWLGGGQQAREHPGGTCSC